jgi:uncharacterized membrane protein
MKLARPPLLAGILLGCFATLVIAYAIKTNCPPQDSGTYPRLCYSDITALYVSRGLATGTIPYVDFPKGGSYDDPGFLEYPVLTGVVVGLTSLPSTTPATYLAWNAAILGSVALAVAALLTWIAGASAWRWSAAPAVVLYAFANWDLLAVGCVVAGCVLAARQRHSWAGFWFGLGAAAKLFPAVFVLPLLLDRVGAGDRRGALRVAGSAAAALIVPNAVLAVFTDGWWATYAFHSHRGADLGSVWAWIAPQSAPSFVNLASTVTLALAGTAVVFVGWQRRGSDGRYPVLQVGSCLLALVMLTSKIASPQQALWLLPCFTLLSTRLRWWLAWNGGAVLVFIVSFGVGLLGYGPSMAWFGIGLGALVRALLLSGLIFVFLDAEPVARRWEAGGHRAERLEPRPG